MNPIRGEHDAGPSLTRDGPVVLFDGGCGLCHATVRWLIERDPGAVLRFASIRSGAARALLAAAGEPGDETTSLSPRSVVLVEGRGVYRRSDAVLRILRRLGRPWSFAIAFAIVPRFARDAVYDLVARHRHGVSGRRPSPRPPEPEWKARFLDADEVPPALPPDA